MTNNLLNGSTERVEEDELKLRSGLPYRSLGRFFEAAIQRRGLTVDEVASRTGISSEELESLIEDKKRFDRPTIRKLQLVFPSTTNMFRRMQDDVDTIRKRDPQRLETAQRRFYASNGYSQR